MSQTHRAPQPNYALVGGRYVLISATLAGRISRMAELKE
jgi:hypothetical protein